MCGIGLIIDLETTKTKISKDLDIINISQKHRGPDFVSKKIYNLGKNAYLGMCHQRLSIIELSSRSHQPIEFCNGRYVMIFNGEIYNYKNLKKKIKNTENFGDTLVLTKYWENFGKNCFQKFRGMWAIIIFDKKTKQVTLCRDRFGIKPIYKYEDNNKIICTSEIKAILNIIKKDQLNINTINNYLYLGIQNYSTETFFKNIFSLKTGTIYKIKITSRNIMLHEDSKILNQNKKEQINTFSEAVSRYGEKLTHSIKNHFESDVEIGILLSGGLDSNGIYYLGKKLNKKIKTFSFFGNKKISEEKMIKLVTQKKNNYYLRMSSYEKYNIKNIINLSYINEFPILSLSTLAHYELMKLAKKKKIKVLITGQGADEVLLGYRKFIFFYLWDLLVQKKIFQFIKKILLFARNSEFISGFNFSDAKKYISCFNTRFNKSMFVCKKPKLENISYSENFSSRILKDQNKYSIPALLNYEDKISMSCGIEMRVPYLDEDLTHYLNSLSPDFKFYQGISKAISKKFFERKLPNEIINNKKRMGFILPQNNIYNEKNKKEILRVFSNSIAYKKSIINKDIFFTKLQASSILQKENKELDRTLFFLSWLKAYQKYII